MHACTFEWAHGGLRLNISSDRNLGPFCLCHISARLVQEMCPASLSASRNRMDQVCLDEKPCVAFGSEMGIGAGCFLSSLCKQKFKQFLVLSLLDIISAKQSCCLLIRSGWLLWGWILNLHYKELFLCKDLVLPVNEIQQNSRVFNCLLMFKSSLKKH